MHKVTHRTDDGWGYYVLTDTFTGPRVAGFATYAEAKAAAAAAE